MTFPNPTVYWICDPLYILGTTLYDVGTAIYNGTINAGITITTQTGTGANGNCADFGSGAADRNVKGTGGFPGTGNTNGIPNSWAAWVKVATAVVSTQDVVIDCTTASLNNGGVRLVTATGSAERPTIFESNLLGTNSQAQDPSTLSSGVWVLYSSSYATAGTANLKLYKNATQVATANASTDKGYVLSANNIAIGSIANTGGVSRFFSGQIGRMAFWNNATLSAADFASFLSDCQNNVLPASPIVTSSTFRTGSSSAALQSLFERGSRTSKFSPVPFRKRQIR